MIGNSHIMRAIRETAGMSSNETPEEVLRQADEKLMSRIIHDTIQEHAAERARMINRYQRYRVEVGGVPILAREMPDYERVNNKLNNDFFSEIIDTKVGYFMGIPIVYNVERDAPNAAAIDEKIQEFNRYNDIENQDSEKAKYAAICGYAAEHLYIDRDGMERSMVVPPWEVVFIYDRSLDEPQFVVRYYRVGIHTAGGMVDRWRAEWYDSENVSFWIETDTGRFQLDDTEMEPIKPHLWGSKGQDDWGEVPWVLYENNEERLGDADKVINLIDAYDRTMSDVNSEIESFRLAYMIFYGQEPDEETLEAMRETGAIVVPPMSADGKAGKVEFLTKQLDDSIIEHHLDRVSANILRFAKSVDFTDEQFAGNLSGVAMRFKLFGLETKCITAERKFQRALRRRYKLLAKVWRDRYGIDFNHTDLSFQFTRNLPVNILDEAQATVALKGMVSERTRLGLLSFVDDVDMELDEMAREAMQLDTMFGGTGGGVSEDETGAGLGGGSNGETPGETGTGTDS